MRRGLAVDGAVLRDGAGSRRGRRMAGRMVAVALAVFAFGLATDAVAQDVCASNQAQLAQAITDSRSALDRVSATLDGFARDLIGPRTGALDAGAVTSARSNLDAFISALREFSGQVRQIGLSCGPQFASDAQTLEGIVGQFEAARQRADTLLADHQALVSSGEPAMTQAQMEGVQRALAEQGFYQGGADGRFGPGTREGIRRFQEARGLPVTGYLTPEQLAQLIQPQTAAASPDADTPPAVPDPDQSVADTPPPAGPSGAAVDPQAAQICAQNTREVDNAVERTRTFRQQINTRIGEFRTAIRGPRIPAIDGEAGNRILSDVSSYLGPLESFHEQARAVVGHCDATYDESFRNLTAQLEGLRGVTARVVELNEDYAALVASGEPAMSEETMRQVQEGLKARGHYTGAVDAVYGPGTRDAIRAYQAAVGAAQTGYLTAEQIAALQQPPPAPEPPQPVEPEVTEVAEPVAVEPPPPPEPDTIADATAGSAPGFAAARERLERDLSARQPPAPLSGVGPGDGRFGELWWRTQELVVAGREQEALDQRLALFGAAYLDRGADSPSMIDAHLLVGDAFVRLGLYGDAAFHLQRAHDIWSGLRRQAPQEAALLLERLAAARLAEALGDGPLAGGAFDDIGALLGEALAAAGAEASALRTLVLDRMADLHVAADRSPADPAVQEALAARYRD